MRCIRITTFSSFLRDFEYRFEEWRGTEFSGREEIQQQRRQEMVMEALGIKHDCDWDWREGIRHDLGRGHPESALAKGDTK